MWDEIAAAAAAESTLWAEALLPRERQAREAVFSTFGPPTEAVGLETIYEGYLLHYGRPRLFSPPDADAALLLGDYLYAQGLVRVARGGDVDAVADLAELISLCAQLRAEHSTEDGPAWAASVALLGRGVLKETENGEELLSRAREAAGEEAVDRSLEAHARRVG